MPTKQFLKCTINAKYLGVDPLGYKKRGGRDHPTPVGDAPAPDILCISLTVNFGYCSINQQMQCGSIYGDRNKYWQSIIVKSN